MVPVDAGGENGLVASKAFLRGLDRMEDEAIRLGVDRTTPIRSVGDLVNPTSSSRGGHDE